MRWLNRPVPVAIVMFPVWWVVLGSLWWGLAFAVLLAVLGLLLIGFERWLISRRQS